MCADRSLLILLLVAFAGFATSAFAQPVAPFGYVLEPAATGLGDASRIAIAPSGFGTFGGQVFAARPSSSEILRIDPTTGSVASFATTIGNTGFFVEFGPGGAFGQDLYVANSIDPFNTTHGLVERIDAAGVATVFGDPTPPPGPPGYQFGGVGMAFSTGGAFGTLLYSGTGGGQISDSLSTLPPAGGASSFFADFGSVLNGTPTELRFGSGLLGFGTDLYVGLSVATGGIGVEDGIYRYDSAGVRTPFALASGDPDLAGAPTGLAFADLGAFAGALYACVEGQEIVQIDDTGDVVPFVGSIGTCSGLAFSEDGQTMYFVETDTGTLWALRRMPSPNASVGNFVIYEEDFRGEATYPTEPEADELGLGGFTGTTDPSGPGPDLVDRVAAYQIDGASGELGARIAADATPLADRSFVIRTRMSGLSTPALDVSLGTSQGAVYADGFDLVGVSGGIELAWDGSGTPSGSLEVVEQRFPPGPVFEATTPLSASILAAILAGEPFEVVLEVTRSGGGASARASLELDDGAFVATPSLAFSIVTTEAFESVRHGFGFSGVSPEVVAVDLEEYEVGQPFAQSFTVDTTADGADGLPGDGFCSTLGAQCTLRAALQEANALTGATEIVLGAGTHTLSIAGEQEDASATGDLDVLDDVEIRGDDAATTIVDGDSIDRVFHVPSDASEPTLRLVGLTVTGGRADEAPNPVGGGVYSLGWLHLEDCIVTGNRASAGAGVVSGNNLTMKGCIVEANEAVDYGVPPFGGGVYVYDETGVPSLDPVRARILDSAIVANVAAEDAGLRFNGSSANAHTAWVENTTVSGNVDGSSVPQVAFAGFEGVLQQVTIVGGAGPGLGASSGAVGSGSLLIANTALSGTPACQPFTSLVPDLRGVNASEDTSCGFTGAGDIEGTSLGLDPLTPVDGTRVHLPAPGSVLVDAADAVECTRFDQRGVPRPVDGDGNGTPACDLGAIEVPEPAIGPGLFTGALLLCAARSRRRLPRGRSGP